MNPVDLDKTPDRQPQPPQLLPRPRRVAAGRGGGWLNEAWRIIRMKKGKWAVMFLIALLIIGIVANFAPLLSPLLLILFMGGIVLSCDALVEGGQLEVEYVFAGFKYKLADLLVMGVFYLALTALIYFLVSIGMPELDDFYQMDTSQLPQAVKEGKISMGQVSLFFLLDLLIFLPATMSVWFAVPLVVLNDIKPIPAMLMSLKAFMLNIPAFWVCLLAWVVIILGLSTVFGILVAVAEVFLQPQLAPIFVIPLAILLLALLLIVHYSSYRDVWTSPGLDLGGRGK
ncbi:MAG: BPSS1780 family membrane protein [Neisseria sp.]|nr:BPSS1780 family membrane protein [Neisseria sp.]